MTSRSPWARALALSTWPLFAMLELSALVLSRWGVGRMLRAVSLPRMREHSLRTVLTVLGLSLGVAVLIAVALVSRSIVAGVGSTVDSLAGKADIQVQGSAAGFSEDVLETLREIPGVYKITPVVQQITTIRTASGAEERLMLLGVDFLGTDDRYFRDYGSAEIEAIRRDSLLFLNSSTNVILSSRFAAKAHVKLHDKVQISTGTGVREFEVWGFTHDAGFNAAFGGAVGVMYYAAMQVAFDRGSNVDHLDIAVASTASVDAVAKAVQAALGPAFNVDRAALRGERVERMLASVRLAMTMASLIAIMSGAFLAFNTVSISIAQRKRELGVMRTLGITRRQLLTLLTLEGVALGIVGSAFGVLLGLGLSRVMLKETGRAINEIYVQQAVSDVQIDPWMLISGFALGLLCATLASVLAAQRAGSIAPAEALSSGKLFAAPAANRFNRGDLAGLIALGLTLLLLRIPPIQGVPLFALAASLLLLVAGRLLMPRAVHLAHFCAGLMRSRFGAEATLAHENLPRDVGRTSSTAAGLMAGFALSVTIGTFTGSFISSFIAWSTQVVPGDLFLTSGVAVSGMSSRNTPLSEKLGDEVLKLPGVEGVRRLRLFRTDYQGVSVMLLSSEVKEYLKRSDYTMIEGSLDEATRGLFDGKILISENFAARFDTHLGGHVALSTQHGTHEFEVAGVVVDYTNDSGTVIFDRSTFTQHWGDHRVDTYEVNLKPGVDAEHVRGLINADLARKHDLFVLTNSEYRNEFVKAANNIFSLMHVLEVITLLVAALGLVTAMLANVMDRVREIGVLRALGMLPRQVAKLVVFEATMITAVGSLVGIVMGVGLGHIMLDHVTNVQIGWHLPYVFPTVSIVQLLAIILPASALAALLPARSAAGLVVREALDRE